jgi:hypothetical protein
VMFPQDQLQILAYNRLVTDLNGLHPEEFLVRVGHACRLSPSAPPVLARPGQVSMYLGGHWLGLEFDVPADADPVSRLDVSLLQDGILAPILGIDDPRTSKRIDFVGGIRGTDFLRAQVDAKRAAVAFSMHPVTMRQLMDIADAGQIMPPKSTWFEPKLRSGLFIHTFSLTQPSVSNEFALLFEDPEESAVSSVGNLRLQFVNPHAARVLRSGHEQFPSLPTPEINHHVSDRRFALRLVGMLPKEQVAGSETFGPPFGIGHTAEKTADPFEAPVPTHIIVLFRGGARQLDAACLANEITGGVRAIHPPRGTFARRNEGTPVTYALGLQGLRRRSEGRVRTRNGGRRQEKKQGEGQPPVHGQRLTQAAALSTKARMPFAPGAPVC